MTTTVALSAGSRHSSHPIKVARIERLTEDSIAVTFAVPAELTHAYRFDAGQHLTIRTDHGGAGTCRSFSIAAPVGGELRIGIKRLPGGAFSSWACENLRPGDELDVMTPSGRFGTCSGPRGARRVVALAAGSGITPVFAIVATALATEPDTSVTLLHGARSTAEVMFLEDLQDLKNAHNERFQLLHFLSREPQTDPLRAGRLDPAKLERLLGAVVDPGAEDWYLCGPAAAVAGWHSTLLAADVPAERIHRELFHTGPDPAVPRPARAKASGVLTVTLDGRSTQTSFVPADTVLDAVLRARPEAPFACRGGICGTCRAMLVIGEVAMDANFALEDDELDRGFVLTCQARPTTASVSVDYDCAAR